MLVQCVGLPHSRPIRSHSQPPELRDWPVRGIGTTSDVLKSSNHRYSILALLFIVTGVAGGAWIVRQFAYFSVQATQSAQIGKLNTVGLGLSMYLQSHGHLPDPVIHSSSGVPSSWRVHISQYFDGGNQFRGYDFGKPWSSATNLSIADACPPYFQHHKLRSTSVTSYTLIPLSKRELQLLFPSFAPEVTDHCVAVTAIVMDPRIAWVEPRDASFDDLKEHVRSSPQCPVLLVSDTGYYDVLWPSVEFTNKEKQDTQPLQQVPDDS